MRILSIGLVRAIDDSCNNAYGWPADISDADALRELLALNVVGG